MKMKLRQPNKSIRKWAANFAESSVLLLLREHEPEDGSFIARLAISRFLRIAFDRHSGRAEQIGSIMFHLRKETGMTYPELLLAEEAFRKMRTRKYLDI